MHYFSDLPRGGALLASQEHSRILELPIQLSRLFMCLLVIPLVTVSICDLKKYFSFC